LQGSHTIFVCFGFGVSRNFLEQKQTSNLHLRSSKHKWWWAGQWVWNLYYIARSVRPVRFSSLRGSKRVWAERRRPPKTKTRWDTNRTPRYK